MKKLLCSDSEGIYPINNDCAWRLRTTLGAGIRSNVPIYEKEDFLGGEVYGEIIDGEIKLHKYPRS